MSKRWAPRFRQSGYWSGRMLLGAIFIYAAIFKIGFPQDFADSVASYKLLPYSVINLLALGLPLFELLCGLIVLTGIFFRIGLFGMLAMLTIFIGAIAVALIRGLPISCGCFESHLWLDSSSWLALIRDAILLGLAVFVYGHSIGTVRHKAVRFADSQNEAMSPK